MTTANTTTTDWQERFISDCVTPFEVERGKKVLAREYKPGGKFPIIDQGQQLVAGYADNEFAVIRDDLPLVVFGDHTRVFKFVDFPFVVGADGTKLLKPKSELDPKFFYFACLSLDIPTRGYNRHFKILREQTIRYPEKSEQQKIAAVLWKIQKAAEIEDAIVRNARDLKKSLLRRLFTHGLRGEPLKETEIGALPESWDVISFEKALLIAQYGLSIRGESQGRFPILRMNCQEDGQVRFSNLQFVDLDEKTFRAYELRDGDLLFNRTNSYELVGRTAIFHSDTPAVFASYLIRLRLDAGQMVPDFVNYYLNTESTQEALKLLATRAVSQSNISASKLKTFQIPKPEKDEQREIADILQTVDRKIDIHESKKRSLEDLFKTTLHKLMTAQIRVNDLDIDTSEVNA
jgi:type I restriction enzyme, S subunit